MPVERFFLTNLSLQRKKPALQQNNLKSLNPIVNLSRNNTASEHES